MSDDVYNIRCTGLSKAVALFVTQFVEQNSELGMVRLVTHEGHTLTIRVASKAKQARLAAKRERQRKAENQ